MRAIVVQNLTLGLVAVALFTYLLIDSRTAAQNLANHQANTGYWLLAVFVLLAVFNARKRLSMIPVIRAALWLRLHVVGGILPLALFWLHTGTLWPSGLYEQILALMFYVITINGALGYILQRVYPHYLTQTGLEIIYERIPTELAALRKEAEELVLECADKTGSDTLARHYADTMGWFFRRPRFFFSHVTFSRRSSHWLHSQSAALRRYLNDAEAGYLHRLDALAETKNLIDLHYTYQSVMKRWLLFHVPLAVALLVLAVWHLIVVSVYAL